MQKINLKNKILLFIIIFFYFSTQVFSQNSELGLSYFEKGEYQNAIKVWLPLAKKGDPESQIGMGMMHHRGLGTPINIDQAVAWYQLAADQGYPKGQSNMGVMYMHGFGVEQNYTKSAKWFHLAAKNGIAMAQLNYAIFYSLGRGVKEDFVHAMKRAIIASKNGNKKAIAFRGLVFFKMTKKERKLAKLYAKECIRNDYKECL